MAQGSAPLVTMTEHASDDGVLVRVSGRLDRRSAADVRLALHRLLADATDPVLLDLDEAVIGDATGLGLLVEVRRRAHRAGLDLRVVAADERTSRLLRRARLHGLLAASARPARPVGHGTAVLAGVL